MKRTLDESNSGNTSIKRFKTATEEDIKMFRDSRQTDSTKRNTKWAVKIIQEWSSETFGVEIDFFTIDAADLNSKLSKFYAEARPKIASITTENTEYHKNTMKNIRAAINRHLADLERDMNIVKDKEFKSANDTLDGKLKHNVKCAISKPTKHKDVITPEDLIKISEYLYSAENPIILRYRVWYDVAMHFVTRGLEFHEQLKPNSFEFLKDEHEREYAVMSHETKQKTIQGGLTNEEANHDKRMYSMPLTPKNVQSHH
ncbi:uncharacterized protein LOC130048610 [Ostrea edulis]|uniref:uncharacterized protein LOC130048610 n=1 Tax=Ostrea edulis TaxID=37623 RepID=UPI0024AFD8E4|nr:uncharacterized protein LOC130048610 [Ostrea edulis]